MIIMTILISFKTNGKNPYSDDIINITAKIHNKSDNIDIIIKPKDNIAVNNYIRRTRKITNQMININGIYWETAYKLFHDWIIKYSDNLLISHNSTNDFILFKRIMSHFNYNTDDYVCIDTYYLSKKLLPQFKSHRVDYLCHKYNIQYNHYDYMESYNKIYDTLLNLYLIDHNIDYNIDHIIL